MRKGLINENLLRLLCETMTYFISDHSGPPPNFGHNDVLKVGQLMKDIQFLSIEEIYFFLTHIHKKRKNIMSFVHMNEISLLKVVSYQSLLAIFTNWNFNLYILKEIDPSIIWLEKLKFQQIFRIQFLHAIKRRCFSVQ